MILSNRKDDLYNIEKLIKDPRFINPKMALSLEIKAVQYLAQG